MDRYAADAATVVAHLGLRDVVHVGHCAGGGEVARYIARHGAGRVAKAVLIAAVPPLMVQTASNPAGLPAEVFDGFREGVATDRSQFYLDLASGPFYGFNRPGADVSQGVIHNWWRQGMAGSAQAHHEGIGAFSETDFTDDLRAIDVPTLLLHGDDDQIVPVANSRPDGGRVGRARGREGLPGPVARHVHGQRRHRQRGPPRLHQGADPARYRHTARQHGTRHGTEKESS